MIEFISQHPATATIISYWLFSAVIGGMPEPLPTSSWGYRWLHSSLHILAGNIATAVSARYPTLTLPPDAEIERQPTDTTSMSTTK